MNKNAVQHEQEAGKPSSTVGYSLNILNRVFDFILDAGKTIGMWLIFIVCFAICFHVVMRYIFNSPINWTVDMAMLAMFYLTYLGTAWLLREDGHVSLDFLYHAMGPQRFGKLNRVLNFICAVACFIVIYFSTMETILAIRLDLAVNIPLEPPKWATFAVIPIGFFLLAIEFLRKTFKGITTKEE
ncbi:MAG: TRAP transporter small permease [Desulfobacteraceae bacterium]|nr:TRAP transporter small permease [Desulfobacteraceae bacterium]